MHWLHAHACGSDHVRVALRAKATQRPLCGARATAAHRHALAPTLSHASGSGGTRRICRGVAEVRGGRRGGRAPYKREGEGSGGGGAMGWYGTVGGQGWNRWGQGCRGLPPCAPHPHPFHHVVRASMPMARIARVCAGFQSLPRLACQIF